MVKQTVSLFRASSTLVWLGLICATLLSWFLGTDNLVNSSKLAGALVLGVAFIKIRFVIRSFMEIRDAPLPLKLLLDGYCVVVCTALIVMFLVAK